MGILVSSNLTSLRRRVVRGTKPFWLSIKLSLLSLSNERETLCRIIAAGLQGFFESTGLRRDLIYSGLRCLMKSGLWRLRSEPPSLVVLLPSRQSIRGGLFFPYTNWRLGESKDLMLFVRLCLLHSVGLLALRYPLVSPCFFVLKNQLMSGKSSQSRVSF